MDWAGPSVLPQKRQQQLPKDSANVLSYAPWGAHPGSRASAAETRAETDEDHDHDMRNAVSDHLLTFGRPQRQCDASRSIQERLAQSNVSGGSITEGSDPR